MTNTTMAEKVNKVISDNGGILSFSYIDIPQGRAIKPHEKTPDTPYGVEVIDLPFKGALKVSITNKDKSSSIITYEFEDTSLLEYVFNTVDEPSLKAYTQG